MVSKLFLNWLERLGRKCVIMDRESNEPYLERYYLFLKERDSFPFNIFLHKFLKGDPDDLHDHPWPYATLILKGGYWEWTPGHIDHNGKWNCEVRRWRGPGHFRTCSAGTYHRIELDPGVECWTIFMPGPKQKDWGFNVNGRWIQHEKYLEERYEQTQNKI